MKKSWTTTKLIAIGSLSALSIILALSGATISVLTGIPGTSGAVNAIWGAVITSFLVFLIPNFGSITLYNLIFSVLALPLPLEGTAGFLPKILIGLCVGLLVDTVYYFLKRKPRLAAVIVGFVSQYLVGVGIYILGSTFHLPAMDALRKLVFSPVAIIGTVLFTGFFGYVGYWLYKKLEKTSVVSRIQQKG